MTISTMRTYALLAIAIIACTSVALAQKIALVVGNDAYQYAPELNNPIADAVDVSRILESGGFRTLKLTDAN
jgi:xanthosine utilization system XapX-like protein